MRTAPSLAPRRRTRRVSPPSAAPSAFYASAPQSSHGPDLSFLPLLLQRPLPPSHLRQIHGRVFRLGAHQDDLVATRLIGRLPSKLAPRVLVQLLNPGIFPFNAALRVLSESGLSAAAFSVFDSLKRRGLSPNGFTFSFILKACVRSADVWPVREVHSHVTRSGLDGDSSVCDGLVLAYAKGAGDSPSASKLFDQMPEKVSLCSWSCLIKSLAEANRPNDALTLFLRLLDKNLRPDDDTMVGVLSACSKVQEIESWANVFSKRSVLAPNCLQDSVDTVSIYLCGKSGDVERGRNLFDTMLRRSGGRTSVVMWNAMITGYAQNGHPSEALDVFHRMLATPNPKPNHVTLVSVLSACAEVGDLDLGRWVHRYLEAEGRRDLLENNTILATAFVGMYSKCGSLEEARAVLCTPAKKDVILFNAMIMGLAVNGRGAEAVGLFGEMRRTGLRPDGGTFLALLCACTHACLVNEGRVLFTDMGRLYSITPKVEHYASYIDLLARAGHIEEAFQVAKTMPVEPNEQVWGALLGACVIHSRAKAAGDAAKGLANVDPEGSAGYVLLSNAYAIDSRWDDIAGLRGSMNVKGVRKQPGCSWISVDGVRHEFHAGCKLRPEMQTIALLLDLLLKEMRFVGGWSSVY